jgi:hypothetical protein
MKKLLLLLSLSLVAGSAFAADGILVDSSDKTSLSEPLITDILSAPLSDKELKAGAAMGGGGGNPVPEPVTLVAIGAAASLGIARRLRKKS